MFQHISGWVLAVLGGGLYIAQVISSVNFTLAQRLGIQEKPETSDPILQSAERYTARWDLVTLIWLPLAGVLMILNHPWWPVFSLTAGAIYFDTAGREAAKILSFRHQGMATGTPGEQKVYFASYIVMAILGLLLIIFSVPELLSLK